MSVAERYRIIDRLGAGGLGVVHLAEDRATGNLVALKVMPRARGMANLRGEFLALARLRHRNIVEVYDYGLTESGSDYFTMEPITGPSLKEAASDVASPAFYQLIAGVLRGLAFVHARGMVHADLKPSNILVDSSKLATDPMSAARLADFGLAAATDDPAAGASRGTFPYAAPEVYGGRLDARSDLYSFGVVLYELCCGQSPYPGESAVEVLKAQRRGPPASPNAICPELPRELSELLLSLLDPAPGARPQTADEVAARIGEIAGTEFAIGDTRPLMDMSTVFVSRERDLAQLNAMWRDAGAHRGGVALLAGEEGIGVSRLLDELELSTKLEGGQTFRASVRAGDEPFSGFARLMRALLAGLGDHRTERASEWRTTLAPLLGAGNAASTDAASRYALAEAITEVLLRLSSARPIMVLIDDLHLADRATGELIAYVARSLAESSALMVVGSRRTGGESDVDSTTTVQNAVAAAERGLRIDLPPLDRASVWRLVEQSFGRDVADRLAPELHRASGGNPSHAAGALATMVERGDIARERGAWVIAEPCPEIPIVPDAVAATLARAANLTSEGSTTLRMCAVLGEQFTRDELNALAAVAWRDAAVDQSDDLQSGIISEQSDEAKDAVDTADTCIAELVAARLLHADATAGIFEFANRGVAAAIRSTLQLTTRIRLHRLAGEVLADKQARGLPVAPAALARHFLATGDERAVASCIAAADTHSRSLDHHGALQWCERVRPLVCDARQAAEVDARLGQLRALLGDVEGACEAYRSALDSCIKHPAQHVQMALELGELERRVGRGNAALELLMSALDESRKHKLAECEARCQLRIGWVLMYRAEYKAAMEHAVAGHLVARSGNHAAASAELARLRGTIDIYRGDANAALAQLATALDDAEAVGDESQIAGVLHAIGHAAIHAGDYARAIQSLEKAIASSERTGNIEQSAKSLNNLGAACYFQGEWQRARTSWERFRRLCERLDERTELVRALSNLGSLYRELGQFSQARSALQRAQQVAELTKHAHTAAMVTANLGEVLFREGDISSAREHYRRALGEFESIGAREDIIETRRRLCELDVATGNFEDAIERSVDTARDAKDAGARLEEGILHRVAASALRGSGDIESAQWFITRAREILAGLGSRYELAKVDLEAAAVATASGKHKEARGLLDRATSAFAHLGARWDLNQARAQLRRDETTVPVTSESSQGAGLLLELTATLGDRDIERVLEGALDKLLERTRFERGFILRLDADGRPSERLRRSKPGSRAFDRTEAEFSGTIVRRVATSGTAVAVNDIADDAALREQRSILSLGLRQIMCAPMRSRGRVTGIVYIDSTRLAFGGSTDSDPELRGTAQGGENGVGADGTIGLPFLEAFATQLSLAIENSNLAAEEHRKSELLSILAHEIRNPLAGIIGYADMGIENVPTDDPAELFAQIGRDADRLRRLVDNVLELARHESGNVDWSVTPFDMAELVEDLAKNVAPQCDLENIKLVTHIGQLAERALGNPDRIMQVLMNLTSNALKFTPSGGRVTISAFEETVSPDDPDLPPAPPSALEAWAPAALSVERARRFVRVDIADTGPGMNETLRARLFEKFSQGAGRQRSRGVGLGLYISRNIIVRHGGSIFVDSTPGEGSTFSFRIPLETDVIPSV